MLRIICCFVFAFVFNFVGGFCQTTTNFPLPSHDIEKRSAKFAKKYTLFKQVIFKQHEKEFIRLVREGQSPKTLFIGCSDSRVIPELIFAARPGDTFVIRTAGNFVPFYEHGKNDDGVSATIQFAVEVLGVKDIIVCGHSHCGAIKGLFSEETKQLDILYRWLRFGEPAKKITLQNIGPDATDEEKYRFAEHVSVLCQLANLLSYPFVKKMVDEQELFLHGWHFSIETGVVEYYNPASFQFLPLAGVLNETRVEALPGPRIQGRGEPSH